MHQSIFLLITGLSLGCSGQCLGYKAKYICNGECIWTNDPCNEMCLDPNYFYDNGICQSKAEEMIWLCNGEYQSWNKPCDGTCRGFDSIERPEKVVDSDRNFIIDTYWKCPNETSCISSYHLCNNDDQKSGELSKCNDNSHKSREFCDNPKKYGFNLNCTSLNLLQCPGNNTQQCIQAEELCDGVFDCTDR